jgi:hypothetical protein
MEKITGYFLIKVTNMQSGREIAAPETRPSTDLSTASVDKERHRQRGALEGAPLCR